MTAIAMVEGAIATNGTNNVTSPLASLHDESKPAATTTAALDESNTSRSTAAPIIARIPMETSTATVPDESDAEEEEVSKCMNGIVIDEGAAKTPAAGLHAQRQDDCRKYGLADHANGLSTHRASAGIDIRKNGGETGRESPAATQRSMVAVIKTGVKAVASLFRVEKPRQGKAAVHVKEEMKPVGGCAAEEPAPLCVVVKPEPDLHSSPPSSPPSCYTPGNKRSRSSSDDETKPKRPASSRVKVEAPPAKELRQRRRSAPSRYISDSTSNAELIMLQQAINNSRTEQFHQEVAEEPIPEAPTYYPTTEQFKDPLAYIETIREEGEKFGIVKIKPPAGWNPPPVDLTPHRHRRFNTKRQQIHRLQEGESFEEGGQYTYDEYKAKALAFAMEWQEKHYSSNNNNSSSSNDNNSNSKDAGSPSQKPSCAELERDYWRLVGTSFEEVEVDYGNDIESSQYWSGFSASPDGYMEGSCFDRDMKVDFTDAEYYKRCGWNLNNLAFWPGSLLRFFRTHISGVTAPWLYVGMQFATFCWHNEDNYLCSLNYHHFGAPKQWYGVPGARAKQFENIVHGTLKGTMEEVPDLLYHITTMLSPSLFVSRKVPVCRVLQNPGEFVVTFPKAYHGGFSYGFNCGEAVNFATPSWVKYGTESNEIYRRFQRPSVYSHDRLMFTLTMYLPDHSLEGCRVLLAELKRMQQEEMYWRNQLKGLGVRDVSNLVVLPKFQLSVIEAASFTYDDRRMCKVCKHTCFMSGVSCECTQSDVCCLRHWRDLCGCPPSRMFFFFWMQEYDIARIVGAAEDFVQQLEKGGAYAQRAKQSFFRQLMPSTLTTAATTATTGRYVAASSMATTSSSHHHHHHHPHSSSVRASQGQQQQQAKLQLQLQPMTAAAISRTLMASALPGCTHPSYPTGPSPAADAVVPGASLPTIPLTQAMAVALQQQHYHQQVYQRRQQQKQQQQHHQQQQQQQHEQDRRKHQQPQQRQEAAVVVDLCGESPGDPSASSNST